MKPNSRRVSNRKSIICLSIGIVLILLCVSEVVHRLFYADIKGNEINNTLAIFVGVVGGIITGFSIISLRGIENLNKMLEAPDYGVDYAKELSMYKIVGMKNAKVKNGTEKFNKYSEWSEYIKKSMQC